MVPVDGQTGIRRGQTSPIKEKTVQCVKMQTQANKPLTQLPKGLIRSKCATTVNISGHVCNCLLDTDSQVTTIPVYFYNENLSNQPVLPLGNLLQVEGAAGQSVPYLGYVELVITFPEDFMGVRTEIPTLALLVPDAGSDRPSYVLIGIKRPGTIV